MAHTIRISDELWDLYDGSPTMMRDTLWQAKVSRPEPQPLGAGTIIRLQWGTNCSKCRDPLFAGEQGLIRTVEVEDREVKEILCTSCARSEYRDSEDPLDASWLER